MFSETDGISAGWRIERARNHFQRKIFRRQSGFAVILNQIKKYELTEFLLYVFYCLTKRLKFFSVIIRNTNIKSLLKLHYNLRVIQRVNAEVFHKIGIRCDFRFCYTEFIN